MKHSWIIIHDCDDEDGNPTCWCLEINKAKYGKYVWISKTDTGFDVEVDQNPIVAIQTCTSLQSAKRWVTRNLLN